MWNRSREELGERGESRTSDTVSFALRGMLFFSRLEFNLEGGVRKETRSIRINMVEYERRNHHNKLINKGEYMDDFTRQDSSTILIKKRKGIPGHAKRAASWQALDIQTTLEAKRRFKETWYRYKSDKTSQSSSADEFDP